MADATGVDPVSFYLAYLHPVWMLASLAMAVVTLRAGLRLRTARRRGIRKDAADYRSHLRFAKPTMGMLLIGFGAGLLSVVLLRGWDVFSTAHGFVSTTALVLFLATAALGRRLEKGQSREPEIHGILALLSVFSGAAAFGTGFVLLP